jgi:hypothetical protein
MTSMDPSIDYFPITPWRKLGVGTCSRVTVPCLRGDGIDVVALTVRLPFVLLFMVIPTALLTFIRTINAHPSFSSSELV